MVILAGILLYLQQNVNGMFKHPRMRRQRKGALYYLKTGSHLPLSNA